MSATLAFATKVDEDALGRNLLLSALPEETRERLLPDLQWVELQQGDVLYGPNEKITHIHFPTTATVSLLQLLEDGTSIQVAVVGNEGVAGVTLFLGGGLTLGRAVVQNSGRSLRLAADKSHLEFDRGGPAVHVMLRYTAALIAQMCQTAVCNRRHSLDQRLSRWLLLSLDRVRGNQIEVTQESIAELLGVRRAGVNESASRLRRDRLIDYERGHVVVIDRPALESRACECYAAVRSEYARLLPPTGDTRAQGTVSDRRVVSGLA